MGLSGSSLQKMPSNTSLNTIVDKTSLHTKKQSNSIDTKSRLINDSSCDKLKLQNPPSVSSLEAVDRNGLIHLLCVYEGELQARDQVISLLKKAQNHPKNALIRDGHVLKNATPSMDTEPHTECIFFKI